MVNCQFLVLIVYRYKSKTKKSFYDYLWVFLFGKFIYEVYFRIRGKNYDWICFYKGETKIKMLDGIEFQRKKKTFKRISKIY